MADDPQDISWTSSKIANVIGAFYYVDRSLTRWEWLKVHVLRRPDPRLLGAYSSFSSDAPEL